MAERTWGAVVVGAGPNGLAAAIVLAQAGRSVQVLEAEPTIGGGTRSAAMTLPGFLHDICSAIHPLAIGSPFFGTLPLREHGLELIHSPAVLAHPLDDGSAALLQRSIEATGESLGPDAAAWSALMSPLVRQSVALGEEVLGPFRIPRHPFLMTRFGMLALRSAVGLATSRFSGPHARALFGGLSAHSMLRLDRPPSAAFGMLLGTFGHAVGWPLPRGGSQQVADALASHLRSLGGEIVTGRRVRTLADVPHARAVLFDLGPKQLLTIVGDRFPSGYRKALMRYRYGPGAFKLDYALDGPIPWRSAACAQAATVHLGGTLEEIAAAEAAVWRGEHPERPFVLLAQQSLFDPTRAPAGKHTLWAYTHVPNGSTFDMTDRIERQIERFAPGFRDRILARSVMTAADFERYNPNYVGGDINAGVQDLGQLFTRPTIRLDPYTTPVRGLYLCSSSTPPGGGVHGMCGYHAARSALRHL